MHFRFFDNAREMSINPCVYPVREKQKVLCSIEPPALIRVSVQLNNPLLFKEFDGLGDLVSLVERKDRFFQISGSVPLQQGCSPLLTPLLNLPVVTKLEIREERGSEGAPATKVQLPLVDF